MVRYNSLWKITLVLSLLVLESLSSLAADIDCDNGNSVPAKYPQWCSDKYFIIYHKPGELKVDSRLVRAFSAANPQDKEIRSFALIIANDDYEYWDAEHRKLPGVDHDLQAIKEFLEQQGYDEVLLLRNDDADYNSIRDALDHFILVTQNYANRSRFMFIYDGHGKPPNNHGVGAGIALSKIIGDGDEDPEHNYTFFDLQGKLREIADNTFHTIAIIGSCYSGNVFSFHNNNNNYDFINPTHHGAQAVTSSDKKSVAYSLSNGTAFFQAFFKVMNNYAKLQPSEALSVIAGPQQYISFADIAEFADVVRATGKVMLNMPNPEKPNEHLGPPLFGDIAPDDGDFDGAPFFLLPLRQVAVAANVMPTNPGAAPGSLAGGGVGPAGAEAETSDASVDGYAGYRHHHRYHNNQRVAEYRTRGRAHLDEALRELSTGSGIIGQPNIAVFDNPLFYPIRGVDLSKFSKNVDFAQLKRKDGLQFAYLKGTEGAHLADETYAPRAEAAVKAGLRVGAYHVFAPCDSVDQQLANLKSHIPVDEKLLPIAIDVELFDPQSWGSEDRSPTCQTVAQVQDLIYRFALGVQEIYRKPPIIYVPASATRALLDPPLQSFATWLASYHRSTSPTAKAGGRPWTLWQFAENAKLHGIEGPTDIEVFFGTAEQFEDFANGGGDVAMRAVTDR